MAIGDVQSWEAGNSRWTRSGSVVTDIIVFVLVIVAVVGAASGKWFVAALCALVLAVAVVSRLWARLALMEVAYRCVPSTDRLMIGDVIDLALTVENRKPLPLPWISVSELIPADFEFIRDDLVRRNHFGFGMFEARETASLRPYERATFRFRLRARKRGHFALGPTRITSGDLFGFYESRLDTPKRPPSLIVYPRTVPLPQFHLTASRPIGDMASRDRLVEDLTRPSSLRDYRPGDSARRIDWKATARRDDVLVRTFDPSVTQRVVILLDCDTSGPGHWNNRPAVLEAAVTGAASIAVRSVELGYAVGLITNGNIAGSLAPPVVAPGAGPDQLTAVMTSLAGVSYMTTKRLEELVAGVGPAALPFGATVVYIGAAFPPSTVAFLTDLGRRDHRIAAVFIGDGDPPEIPELPIADYSAVFTLPEHADA